MTVRLKIFCIFVILLYYIFLFYLIKKKSMLLRYSLLWMFAGFMFTIFALFPEILNGCANIMGFNLASNLLFTVCIGAGMIVVMGITVIVSFQKMRLKQLSQAIAMLENRIDKNEKCITQLLIEKNKDNIG